MAILSEIKFLHSAQASKYAKRHPESWFLLSPWYAVFNYVTYIIYTTASSFIWERNHIFCIVSSSSPISIHFPRAINWLRLKHFNFQDFSQFSRVLPGCFLDFPRFLVPHVFFDGDFPGSAYSYNGVKCLVQRRRARNVPWGVPSRGSRGGIALQMFHREAEKLYPYWAVTIPIRRTKEYSLYKLSSLKLAVCTWK